LLLAKLHRMQFGRKSEKLQRQIEQLELRLEELESHRSEKECNAAKPDPVIASSTPAAAKPTRRALPDHLPRQTRRHEPKAVRADHTIVLYRNYFVDWTARQFGAQQPYPLVLKF